MNILPLSNRLRSAVSMLHKRLRKQIYSMGSYSITEIATVGFLYRNPSMLPSELASNTKVTTQTMSQLLKKLEKHKLIIRTPSDTDKRKVYISLTRDGHKMVEQTRYERDEWLANAIEKSLSEKEKDLLNDCIPILNKLAEFS